MQEILNKIAELKEQTKEMDQNPPRFQTDYYAGIVAAYTVCEKLIKDHQKPQNMGTRTSRLAIWDYYEKAYKQAKEWHEYYQTWCDIAQTSPDHKVRENARYQANGCLEMAKSWERIADQHFQTIKNTYQ